MVFAMFIPVMAADKPWYQEGTQGRIYVIGIFLPEKVIVNVFLDFLSRLASINLHLPCVRHAGGRGIDGWISMDQISLIYFR